MQDFAC